MARYTPEFLAAAKHGYEATDQPMRELARALGIGITTLSTLAEKHGWAKRSQRKRGLPPALQVLEEARALARSAQCGAPVAPAAGPSTGPGGEAVLPGPEPAARKPGRRLRGHERKTAPASTAPPPSLLERLEQILAQLIAAEEAAPANGLRSPQSARNLAILIQAMRALQGMRGALPNTGSTENDDDMPADIDEFRRDLARRIDAFVASRTHGGDAAGDCAAAPVAKT